MKNSPGIQVKPTDKFFYDSPDSEWELILMNLLTKR